MKAEDIKEIAKLAKIKVSDEDAQKFAEELGGVLDYVQRVQNYKFISKKQNFSVKMLKLREDKIIKTDNSNLISQFTEEEHNLLKVKKIL